MLSRSLSCTRQAAISATCGATCSQTAKHLPVKPRSIPGIHRNHHRLDLDIVVKGNLCFFAAPTALLETAEGHIQIEIVVGVDPNCTCLNLARRSQRGPHVARTDT